MDVKLIFQEEEKSSLLELLRSVRLNCTEYDTIIWSVGKDDIFTVKSLYLSCEQNPGHQAKFLKLFWKNFILPKIQFFSWVAVQNIIPTCDILAVRKILPQGADTSCPLCTCGLFEESATHLLVLCKVSLNIWSLCFLGWNQNWVCWNSIAALSEWWTKNVKKNPEGKLLICTFFSAVWPILLLRNEVVFNNANVAEEQVVEVIKIRAVNWIKAWGIHKD